jgi:hypothetical protein
MEAHETAVGAFDDVEDLVGGLEEAIGGVE